MNTIKYTINDMQRSMWSALREAMGKLNNNNNK